MGRIKRCFKTSGEKLLKPYKNWQGYLRVDIKTDGKRKSYLVHRLVALHFIENDDENKNTIDHADNDK